MKHIVSIGPYYVTSERNFTVVTLNKGEAHRFDNVESANAVCLNKNGAKVEEVNG